MHLNEEMRKLFSEEEWAAALSARKRKGIHYLSNKTFFGKIDLQAMKEGRLFFQEREEALYLMENCGPYWNLDYRLEKGRGLEIPKADMPILVNVSFSETAKDAGSKEHEEILLQAGFKLIKSNYLYRMDLLHEEKPKTEENVQILLKEKDVSVWNQCKELWRSELDITDIPITDLQYPLPEGVEVYWVEDNFETPADNLHIAGAMMVKTEGGRATGWHVAVQPACRNKGVGKKLLRMAVGRAAEQKTPVMQAWISEENRTSIRLHESVGFQRTHYGSSQYLYTDREFSEPVKESFQMK